MIHYAIDYAFTLFFQLWHWFKALLFSTDLTGFYLVMIFIYSVYRLLIAPLTGVAVGVGLAAGSDVYNATKAKDPTSNSTEIRKL